MGYAVFCSLACSVSIGVLSVSVSGTFIKKTTASSANAPLLAFSVVDPSCSAVDIIELLVTPTIMRELCLPKISFDCAAARCQFVYNFIYCNG
jgi:hypothetical protein